MSREPAAGSMTATLVRAVLNAVVVATAFLAVAVASGLAADPAAPVVSSGRAPVPGERIIEAHDCWTGVAPSDMKGQLPGHVVVTREGRTVYSAAQVGPALEQLSRAPTTV